MRWWRRRRQHRAMLDAMTPVELLLYGRFMTAPADSQQAWDALPLWIRVALCGECGWLDAVWETDPELGAKLDKVLLGPSSTRPVTQRARSASM